jgi:hypothetical protein
MYKKTNSSQRNYDLRLKCKLCKWNASPLEDSMFSKQTKHKLMEVIRALLNMSTGSEYKTWNERAQVHNSHTQADLFGSLKDNIRNGYRLIGIKVGGAGKIVETDHTFHKLCF